MMKLYRKEALLAHILECDTCLTVIANWRIPTSECAFRCNIYRGLLSESDPQKDSPVYKSASGPIVPEALRERNWQEN